MDLSSGRRWSGGIIIGPSTDMLAMYEFTSTSDPVGLKAERDDNLLQLVDGAAVGGEGAVALRVLNKLPGTEGASAAPAEKRSLTQVNVVSACNLYSQTNDSYTFIKRIRCHCHRVGHGRHDDRYRVVPAGTQGPPS